MIIDGHVHIMGSYSDPSRLIESIDKLGIDKAIVFTGPTKVKISMILKNVSKYYVKTMFFTPIHEFIADRLQETKLFRNNILKRPNNTIVFDAISRYPNRLYGYTFINPRLSTALDELKKCVKDYKMIGIKIHLWLYPLKLTTKKFSLIADFAEKNHLPILIDLGRDKEIARTIFPFIDTYPNVPVIIAHMGLYDIGLEAAKKSDNVYLDTSGYVNTPKRVMRAVEKVGAERLIFGSDAPPEFGGDQQDSLNTITKLKISFKEKSMILGDNLASILHL